MTLRTISALASAPAVRSSPPGAKSDAALAVVAQLAVTDRHVRAHEREQLVGGEVTLDDSPVSGDPAATIEKEKTVIAAANAPADPSAQDRAVASAAAMMEEAAEREMHQQRDRQAAAAYNQADDAVGQVLERYF